MSRPDAQGVDRAAKIASAAVWNSLKLIVIPDEIVGGADYV